MTTCRERAWAQPVKADLTQKQARFVEEYLKDLNAKQAAIRAGYSERSAEMTGSRMMSNDKVAAAVADAQEARSKRTDIDADWVLRRLAEEVEADLADIIGDGGEILPVKKWPKVWRQGLVAGIEVKEDHVEGVKVGETVKIKLSDRIKRIELIGKHVNVQAFREQLHQTGAISLTVSPDDAEL